MNPVIEQFFQQFYSQITLRHFPHFFQKLIGQQTYVRFIQPGECEDILNPGRDNRVIEDLAQKRVFF